MINFLDKIITTLGVSTCYILSALLFVGSIALTIYSVKTRRYSFFVLIVVMVLLSSIFLGGAIVNGTFFL